jgi:hypothetical protein
MKVAEVPAASGQISGGIGERALFKKLLQNTGIRHPKA